MSNNEGFGPIRFRQLDGNGKLQTFDIIGFRLVTEYIVTSKKDIDRSVMIHERKLNLIDDVEHCRTFTSGIFTIAIAVTGQVYVDHEYPEIGECDLFVYPSLEKFMNKVVLPSPLKEKIKAIVSPKIEFKMGL